MKAPFFKVLKIQIKTAALDGLVTKVIVFTRDDSKLCYEYALSSSAKREYFCEQCKQFYVHVKLQLIEDTANGDYVKLSNTPHRCEPQIYDPSKYVDSFTKTIPESAEKLNNYHFDTFTNSDGSKMKYLTIIDPDNNDVCYNFHYHTSNHVYQCVECMKLSKYVTVKPYQNEANELLFENGKNGHVCVPQPVATTIDKANFKIKKAANGKFKRLTIFTSGSREFCYRYFWTNRNYFRCKRCFKQKSIVGAKLYEKENGKYYVKMDNHVCDPVRYLKSQVTQE